MVDHHDSDIATVIPNTHLITLETSSLLNSNFLLDGVTTYGMLACPYSIVCVRCPQTLGCIFVSHSH